MKLREVTPRDIPAIFEIRVATNENNFTYEELEARGITFEVLEEKLLSTYKGWLCEIDNEVVGFVIADKKTAEIWALAILPLSNNQQIEAKLLNLAEHWLISSGKRNFHTSVNSDKKANAYSFS